MEMKYIGAKAKLIARVSLQPVVRRFDVEEDDCGLRRRGRKVSWNALRE